jgi:hypothetical protein
METENILRYEEMYALDQVKILWTGAIYGTT